jgi:hypothetical protein
LTNDEVVDKLNRLKVYQLSGATGVDVSLADDGVATASLATIVPGDHFFTGNIYFNGTMTTVNTSTMTVDDYNLVLGAVGASNGGTNDTVITNQGGGGIIIAGTSGDKYFLWKSFEPGKTFSAWRISDALAFTADAKFYSNNNSFVFSEGAGGVPASNIRINTPGNTIDVQTYFASPGATYTNMNFMSDGSSRMIDSSIVKRFSSVGNISAIGLTFGMVVRHDPIGNGITLAFADSATNAETLGIAVTANSTTQIVDACLLGYVVGNFSGALASDDGATSLGTGEFYFLSDIEPGKISRNSPTEINKIRKPMLYALGHNKAMVMNYVGNKIVNIDSIYSKLNASTVVIKHDADYFSVGDVVRFEEGITASDRPFGSYVKASSNSTEEAEALGIISKTNYGGNSAASLMTTSGFIDLSLMGTTLTPGLVYFVGSNPGKLTETAPVTVNTVRKPMLVAVSPTSGIVQNYVGFVVNTTTDTGTSIVLPSNGSGFKNKLINGNFDIWQRGTTFAFVNPTSQPDRYTADRWKLVNSGGSTSDRLNVRVNRVPIGLGEMNGSSVYSKYGMEFDIGTGGYTNDSQTYLYQRVEGIENLSNGYATISFYAKASVGNARLGVGFRRDFGGGTAPDYLTTGVEPNSQKQSGFVVSVPTSWQKFTYTFRLPDSKGGVVGASGTDGPEIKFFVRAGSTYAGKDISEEINPTIAGVNNYKIYLAQVQLENGQDYTSFELVNPQTEFDRCMRYYQTTSTLSPYKNLSTGSALDNNDAVSVETTVFTPRYPVEIRDGSSCTVNFKDSKGEFVTPATTHKKGFKISRATSARTAVHYEVESEL